MKCFLMCIIISNIFIDPIRFRLRINTDDLYRCPGVIPMWHEMISPYCRRREAVCNATSRYRTIDGSCNNLNRPLWGRSNRPHRRFLPSVYMDGMQCDFEPRHDKTNKMSVRPAKTRISLGIRPV